MSRNLKVALVLTLSAASIGAMHGGWATVTVENLPDQLVVGRPYNLTFSIRQHGEDLLSDLRPYLEVKSKGGERRVGAVPTNRDGYYTATLEARDASEHTVNIETSFGKSNLKLLPIAAVESTARAVSYTESERGKRLFVAKGCLLCHQHAKIADSGRYDAGPDLTDRRFVTTYLKEFLANPSIKAPTVAGRTMPNLNLKDREVSALATFINNGVEVRTADRTP